MFSNQFSNVSLSMVVFASLMLVFKSRMLLGLLLICDIIQIIPYKAVTAYQIRRETKPWNWTSSPHPTVLELLVQIVTYRNSLGRRIIILLKNCVFWVILKFGEWIISQTPKNVKANYYWFWFTASDHHRKTILGSLINLKLELQTPYTTVLLA